MKTLSPLSPVAVIGLGRVGRTVAQYLTHKKYLVYAYDDNAESYQHKSNASLLHNQYFMMMHGCQWPISNKKPQLAICSPGLSEKSKIVEFLRLHAIPILDEIEFTAQLLHQPIIAVTGTNGKSTTTALIGKMLDADGKNVFWGGNLAPGLPFALTLMQENKDFYVIEVSSFQLERSQKFHPHIAVLLNITADHLDRHLSLKEYQKTKFRIFANQDKNDFAIINRDDPVTIRQQDKIPARKIWFSSRTKTNGAYIKDNQIYFNSVKVYPVQSIRLFGTQYLGSILAAVTVAKLLGVKNRSINKVLANFTGLEHRLEFVAEYKGVKYINNSMCTNPEAGAATLASFTKPVVLICGGKEKNLDIAGYIKAIIKHAKTAILVGDNSKKLAVQLEQNNYHNFHLDDSLKTAVKLASKIASVGDIVLFSPGFASFDQFNNFQERGRAFKEYVYELR